MMVFDLEINLRPCPSRIYRIAKRGVQVQNNSHGQARYDESLDRFGYSRGRGHTWKAGPSITRSSDSVKYSHLIE